MKFFRTAAVLMVLFGWLGGCSSNGSGPADAKAVLPLLSAEDLLAQIRSGQAPVIVDVRQPEELTGPLGALPGAVNIPLGELPARIKEIPRDQRVALICRTGNRSGQAYRFLQNKGYTRIQNVNGGMVAVREVESRE